MQVDKLVRNASIKVADGATAGEIAAWLYDCNVSVIDAIKVVRQVFTMPLGEAKQVVTNDPRWASLAEANEDLHKEFIEVAESSSTRNKSSQ